MSADHPGAAAPAWPAGTERLILEHVDSTNAEALRRVPWLTGPMWILARRQIDGRGRRGRAWTDPPGNFAATLVQRIDEPPARLALRSFVAALALHDALAELTGLGPALQLKWPNDVLLNGGKLSGILLETGEQGALAIGIGVNLHASPPADPEAAFPPIALRPETGHHIAPDTLLDHLGPAMAAWEDRLRNLGFAPLREAFLSRAARLGQTITARTGRDSVTGRFDDIDAAGSLVLETEGGRRIIPAADIHF